MSDRTLLASVVLFRELNDSDKDVYDVIAEFLKASLLFSQRWSDNTTQATQLLANEFELTLPEAVVGTDLPPDFRSTQNLGVSSHRSEDGHEKEVQRNPDHRFFERGRSRR